MFKPIKGGSVEKIDTNAGMIVDCHIPPIGYGIHAVTCDLVKADVIMRSTKAKKQKWEPTQLPQDYKKRLLLEEARQKDDIDYFDPELESFREQEWNRRLSGVWVYIKGKPTYLTGGYYFYLNYWPLDDGLPMYRDTDRKRFYFEQYCVEDERCAGILEGSNRRSGKSYRGASFVYEYVSRNSDANGGIQSKTSDDAAKFFRQKLATPFKRLPGFFQPQIDEMAGTALNKEIKFTTTQRKGKRALIDMDSMGLNSFINFKPSGEYAYDGEKLHRYIGDEVGKPSDANAYDRWNVVRYCLRVGKKWIGKALLTTTPEEMEGQGMDDYPFKMLWVESDMSQRDDNGHTKSGLYRYFIPAYETLDFDEYGMPDIVKNKEFLMNTRAKLKGKGLASEIKKNPFTVEEMFRPSLKKDCLYDWERLSERHDLLSWNKDHIVRGDLVWDKGVRDSKVVFKANREGGRFWFYKAFLKSDYLFNNVETRGDAKFPLHKLKAAIGIDPYDHDNTEDTRRSKAAAFGFIKNDPMVAPNLCNIFGVMYFARPPQAAIFYEDMIMLCHWLGTWMLFESQKIGIKKYFCDRGYERFLMKLSEYKDYGIPSTPANKQTMAGVTEAYITDYIDLVWFDQLVMQWMDFQISETEKFDLAMAAGWTLVADSFLLRKQKKVNTVREATDVFPEYLL